ncbi:MAG: nuclear transport factor 2 family protein [Rubrivivax sp.]|nr:nuclear transport factor 2 family protein [Rubrivivax sp.]
MLDIEKSIARLIANYSSAVHAKDVDAFARLYDPKARVFDAWGVWLYDGLEPWRRAVEAWFTSLGTERVKVTFEEVQSSGTSECAVVSAIATYAGFTVEGKSLRSMQNRLTWGLKTSGHVLRIIHEHTSSPVGFDDMKAILVRKSSS